MPLLTTMLVNGYDTSRLGVVVDQVDGWMDGLTAEERVSKLPGRVGAIPLAPDTETSPREITVAGVLRASSLTAYRQAMLDFKERIARGLLELTFVDQTDKFVHALVKSNSLVATRPQFLNTASRFSVSFLCPDPLIYARQCDVVAIPGSAVRAAVALGSAVSQPTIRIMGPATNPVLTYRKADGTSQRTMGFTVTLASTDYLEIDSELSQVSLYQSGVGAQNNAQALWTSCDFILFDPQDGDPYVSSWPTIELSAGSGEALYRRAWL